MDPINIKVAIISIAARIPEPGGEYLKDCWLAELENLDIAKEFDDSEGVARIERYLKIQFNIWKGENDFKLPDSLEQVPGEDKQAWLDRCYKVSGYL